MSLFKLPTSALYRGLARIFLVVAVCWTGLILIWVWGEQFDLLRPDAKTVERVDHWFAEIAMLSPPANGKFDDLPAERRRLIQKAADTGAYHINGHEQNLTEPERQAYKAILQNAFSKQLQDTLVRACKSIETAKGLSGMQQSDRYIADAPAWDFRGIDGVNLESLSDSVGFIIHELKEIQIFDGWERNVFLGTIPKYKFTGEFTGLVTENDLSLLDDLRTAQKSRRIVKPLFWVAAWIVPLLGLGLATLIVVELCRWIARGFRPSAGPPISP